MPCGHSCEKYCHFIERTPKDPSGHDSVACMKPCIKKRVNCDHECSNLCHTCKKGDIDGGHKSVCTKLID